MKKLILALALAGALSLAATNASARGFIIYSNGEKLEITQKFPETEDFTFDDGEHMNLGVMYNQFSIFWIPMWNYGETKWVFVNDKRDSYSDELTAEDIETLRTEYGFDIPDEPKIGFWNRVGGKIVWGIIIALILCAWWWTREKKKPETAAGATSEVK
jgi:hypothetical protein